MRPTRLAGVGVAWVLVSLVACFGDDVVRGAGSGADSGTEADGRAASDGAPDGSSSDAGGDASRPLVCEAGTAACEGACVDTSASGEHCGACGHTCGGGTCVASLCQPMVIRDGLTYPVFDIDASKVYFNTDDKVLACPLAGCGSAQPTQIGAITAPIIQGNVGGAMLVSGGNVYFMADALSGTSGPYFHACGIDAGCLVPPIKLGAGGHQGFSGAYAADGGDVYWGWYKYYRHAACAPGSCAAPEDLVDNSLVGAVAGPLAADGEGVYFQMPAAPTVLARCPKTGPCTPVAVGTVAPFQQLAARGGLVYMLASGGSGYFNGKITTCPNDGAACVPKNFVVNQPMPTAITVDARNVTWFNSEAPSGPPANIVTCPVGGCAGGPRTLAANQVGAYNLRSDDAFVYWATPTAILRVAK